MKKIFLLFFASLLVLSCTKDVELADSTADLSSTLAQYDDTNMGTYKGLFTTVGTMERGTIEINITPNNYGVATLKLVSGQEITFKADRTIQIGAEVQDLAFISSSVMASFKLSADLDGNNVQISDVVYKGITSGAIAAHETSRAPVTPITGVLACDDCDAHPLLVTGDTGTFSLLFVGDGSADDTVTSIADVGVVVSTGGAQSGCVDGGTQTTCDVTGGGTIGNNVIGYVGTHLYDNTAACSSANGTWSLTSNHGAFTGTFTSDDSCAAPANDTCATAEAIACGDSVTGNSDLASDSDGLYGPDVWYSLTGLTPGDDVTVSLCGGLTDYDSRLVIWDACGGAELFNVDDSCGLQSEITFSTDGSDVLISIQAFSTATGNYGLDITCITPAPPTCTDGIMNGDETGIDCGGTICPPCAMDAFIPVCGEMQWTDDGGSLGDYSTGINEVHTVDGGAGNVVNISFTAFDIESDWDYMAFYDGATTADPEILLSDLGAVGGPSGNNAHHGFTGGQLLADGVTSTGQFLTVEFQSDTSVPFPGWIGQVDCSPPSPTSNGGDKAVQLKYHKKATAQEIANKKAIMKKLGISIKN